MNIENSLFVNLDKHPVINKVLNTLMFNEFIRTKDIQISQQIINSEEIRKTIWLLSFLSNSNNEEHIKKVQNISTLLFLNYKDNLEIIKSAYVLLSRTGNLTSTKFFTNLFDDNNDINEQKFIVDFDFLLEVELSNTRDSSLIKIGRDTYLTTKFQKDLWNKLENKQNISISAPTSSGKSFIIKKFIKKSLITKNKILYIVPSRALINQVSEEFRIDLNVKNVEIKTAFIESDILSEESKIIYILTPERCLKLLQHSWNSNFYLDIIFVDEVQNAEDESGRGNLFEYVLRELAIINSNAQIICAGPYIINVNNLYYKLFGLDNIKIETTISPVFQIKSIVNIENNIINIEIQINKNNIQKFSINTNKNIGRKFNKSIGDGSQI